MNPQVARRLLAAWLGYVLFAAAWRSERPPLPCPLRLLTGHPCPLCGTTRAVGLALRGDLPGSLRRNVTGIAVLLAGPALVLARAGRNSRAEPCRPGATIE